MCLHLQQTLRELDKTIFPVTNIGAIAWKINNIDIAFVRAIYISCIVNRELMREETIAAAGRYNNIIIIKRKKERKKERKK